MASTTTWCGTIWTVPKRSRTRCLGSFERGAGSKHQLREAPLISDNEQWRLGPRPRVQPCRVHPELEAKQFRSCRGRKRAGECVHSVLYYGTDRARTWHNPSVDWGRFGWICLFSRPDRGSFEPPWRYSGAREAPIGSESLMLQKADRPGLLWRNRLISSVLAMPPQIRP